MKFTIYQASRQGGRKNNQDRVAYSYSRDALMMVVADGMGGHMYGEIAAQIAVQTLTEQFQKMAKPRLDDPMAFLADATTVAHFAINDYAVEQDLLEIPHTTWSLRWSRTTRRTGRMSAIRACTCSATAA